MQLADQIATHKWRCVQFDAVGKGGDTLPGMQVALAQLSSQLQRGLAPLYVLHGDEPLLQQEAASRQILLFTCQHREQKALTTDL